MINLRNEETFPFRELPKRLQEMTGGKRPHISTCHRWVQKGIRGNRLETVLVGGQRLTSYEAVNRFIQTITAAASGISDQAPQQPSAQRERDIATAEAELDAAGI